MDETVFANLRLQLEQQEWPNVYLFKFIVPNDTHKVALVNALFDDTAGIEYHESRNGKYISVSAREFMLSVDSIIDVYVRSSKIQGLIAL
jgi:hypothetical protein